MELRQTKGTFKIIGVVTRLDKDGAYRQDVAAKGENEGRTYRALRFGVKTSETNEVIVETFDYEPTHVYLWNSEKKKNDPEYKGDKVTYLDWITNQDKYREQGYTVLQTRVGLTYDENGKLIKHGMPSYEASEYIYQHLKNGDSVVIEGEIRYSKYQTQDGQEKERKTFTIKRIFKIKDIDFNAEDFEELSYFEQEMVFVDADVDNEVKKLLVTGRIIDYKQNFLDTQFVIDYSDGDKDMEKLAKSFKKIFKFGDVVTVYGNIVNKVVLQEVEEEETDEEEDLIASLGGKKKPKGAQKTQFTIRDYISEMQIFGVENYEEGVYTEEDFDKQTLIADNEEDENKALDIFGGKKKAVNPFAGLDDNDDFNDDKLPF